VVPERVELHEHPDRDEEERDEDVPKRHQLGERLLTIVRFRDDEAREKCAQRERGSRRRRAERRERPDQDHRDQEQLAAAGLEDRRQDPRHDRAGRDDHAHHHQGRLPQREQQGDDSPFGLAGEERQDQHDRDDAQVLEDQHARRQASVWRIDLPVVGQHFQHDGGARERDQKSEEQRDAPAAEKRESYAERGEHGERHLREPTGQDHPSHLPETAQRELDPDREQQEDHADFGESFHILRIGDESQRVRTQQNPGDDESRQCREFEAVENQDDEE
jgi:hypothetical protein